MTDTVDGTEAGSAASARFEDTQGPLSKDEDDELRRLNFLAKTGALSERSKARMLELRLRDRRERIRPPREFETIPPASQQSSGWARFLRRR